jgi:hypothetical protein
MAASAAVAVEIVPAPDWTEPRLAGLAADHVAEVVVIDLRRRVLTWLELVDGGYRPVKRSALLGLDAAVLAPLSAGWRSPSRDGVIVIALLAPAGS